MPKYHPPVSHYDRGKVQPIDFMEGWFTPEAYRGFLACNVIKYLSRYEHKGSPLDDLHKAKTYLEWLIESVETTDELGASFQRFNEAVERLEEKRKSMEET